MPRPTPDLTGQRFGRLTALSRSPRKGHAYWNCRCDCGNETTVNSSALRRGRTVSCGCYKLELFLARSTKHGLLTRVGRSPTYNSWANMIRRCTKPADPRYPQWGGRGIRVCDRWLDYPTFLADVGERPPGTTLDRIDNNGNYEPGNCRWATPRQQMANKTGVKLTRQVILEIQRLQDQGLMVHAIAEATGMRRQTVGTVCTVLDAVKPETTA
jgi:hypothetical protein